MKKALLIIVAVLAVGFLIGNAELIMSFLDTIKTGALVPILFAFAFMVLRHLIQAASYDAAFEAVGHKTGFKHNVILIFSLVFINTFCLFSGATGLAFIIDDAHREGMDIGKASTGGVLSQLGFFAAVAIISIVGTAAMFFTGDVNPIFVTGGGILALVLVGQTAFLFMGYYVPKVLRKLMAFVERILRKVLGKLNKPLEDDWGANIAESFIENSKILAKNPLGIVITIAWATLSALFNMACLIAIGFSFGFMQIMPLVAAFAVGVVSIMLSPTPQGIGFTEVFIAAILTAYGCSVTTAAAIALVYRGIMLWVPFVVGAFMLSQSGFFKGKKDPTQEQKAKDVGWISGTIMIILGIVCVVMYANAASLAPYVALVQFVDYSNVFIGGTLVLLGVCMVAMGVGLVRRHRTIWALAMAVMIFLCAAEFYLQAFIACVPCLAFAIWLFVKRDAFDKATPLAQSVLNAREKARQLDKTPTQTPMAMMSDAVADFERRTAHELSGDSAKLYRKTQAAQFVKQAKRSAGANPGQRSGYGLNPAHTGSMKPVGEQPKEEPRQ